MAPAAQQSLSQCHLSPAFLSISPTHLSGLRGRDGTVRGVPGPPSACPWPAAGKIPRILNFSSSGANLVFVLLLSPGTLPQDTDSRDRAGSVKLRGLRGHKCRWQPVGTGSEQVWRQLCWWFTSAPWSGWDLLDFALILQLLCTPDTQKNIKLGTEFHGFLPITSDTTSSCFQSGLQARESWKAFPRVKAETLN